MTLKVLGVGVPRTGTSSLKVAFETLGLGACAHMEGLFNQPRLVDYWVELYETGTTDFDALFAGHQSSTDFPGCLLYQELLKQYPELKIVLNYRDPEEWYESMLQTVYPAVPKTPEEKETIRKKGETEERFRNIAKTLALVEVYLLEKHYGGNFLDKEKTLATYRQLHEDIRRNVPANQLLEYEVSQGWEPLCAFLDLPVPSEPFPFKNRRKDFQEQIGKMLNSGGPLTLK